MVEDQTCIKSAPMLAVWTGADISFALVCLNVPADGLWDGLNQGLQYDARKVL